MTQGWTKSNSWVYIDDSYQKARPLSLRPSPACMYALTHSLLCLTADMSAVSHSRHVCCVTQRACLLCDTADIVCCVTQQTLSAVSHSRQCLLFHTADMSAVSHSRQCLLFHTADMSAVSHSRQCLLCQTADMSAVSHSSMSAASNSRHVCCDIQTCRLWDTSDMRAV